MKSISFIIFILLFLTGCSSRPRFKADAGGGKEPTKYKLDSASWKAVEIGIASFYGSEFHGKKTASGETFNMYELTAAHPEYPFGTLLKVTNLENSRSVQVKVNDRGPFVKGRILDLSYAAALKLGFVNKGTAKVKIEVVKLGGK
ncbi:MAG: septal ring lytic transglycosylase RlpA family protein [Fidelibacterota bacterium]